MRSLLLALAALLAAATAPAAAAEPLPLRAGVGTADITPPTGFAFGGWVRADRTGNGAHGRLTADAVVLQRGEKKVALVSVELFAVFAGMVQDIGDRTADLGLGEANLVLSASHTHAGPSGFANFDTYNSIAPSTATATNPQSFADFFDPQPTNRQLYTFLVQRIATAIRRAHADMGPAAAGWGGAQLKGVTKNRSVEAHLANHGILEEPRQGSAGQDPDGADHTIDPEVSVLRIDRLVGKTRRCKRDRRKRCRVTVRQPAGGWLLFANHGTTNPSEYEVYNQDHHGTAVREFEHGVRLEGEVPANRRVIGVYGNGNEGDQSAGLDVQGPVQAARVGEKEGRAMLEAWRDAGKRMTRRPALDSRWTRVCFCGRAVASGERAAESPEVGVPFLTGSEEGRGPLFDITKRPMEGDRDPSGFDSQGHKLGAPGVGSDIPGRVPLYSVRVGERLIITLPAEPTVEIGRRAKAAVMEAVEGSGVKSAVVQGLTGEFIQYLVTPEEYDRQHYEGGSTIFGRVSGQLLAEDLAELSGRLVRGQPAQDPVPFDASNGVQPDGAPYGQGAESGRLVAQPADRVRPDGEAELRWTGGERGLDRPIDDAFITVERSEGDRWVRVTDDRDLQLVWETDNRSAYQVTWGVPGNVVPGVHRLRVTANRYALTSDTFTVAR